MVKIAVAWRSTGDGLKSLRQTDPCKGSSVNWNNDEIALLAFGHNKCLTSLIFQLHPIG